jgi:hypothetical protein
MTDYTNRLKIPLVRVEPVELYTKDTHKLLATDYTRIVLGGRGPYIEFTPHMIVWGNAVLPVHERWRTENTNAFYIEFRSNCTAFVKIYAQKKTVDYADYLPGFCYISPFDLRLADGTTLIDPLRNQ